MVFCVPINFLQSLFTVYNFYFSFELEINTEKDVSASLRFSGIRAINCIFIVVKLAYFQIVMNSFASSIETVP